MHAFANRSKHWLPAEYTALAVYLQHVQLLRLQLGEPNEMWKSLRASHRGTRTNERKGKRFRIRLTLSSARIISARGYICHSMPNSPSRLATAPISGCMRISVFVASLPLRSKNSYVEIILIESLLDTCQAYHFFGNVADSKIIWCQRSSGWELLILKISYSANAQNFEAALCWTNDLLMEVEIIC